MREFLRGRARLLEVTVLPLASLLGLWVLDRLDLLADTPLWVLMALMAGAVASSELVRKWLGDALHARVPVMMLGTSAIMYATGWGPVLAIGYMYGVAAMVRRFGSRAARPAFVWAIAGIGLGQGAVALDIAPTLAQERLAHGLAVLGALGLTFPTWIVFATASQKEQSEAKLVHQAFYDPLSRLPNRTLFVDRLAQALDRARRVGTTSAVLFLDLDRFKVVNDSLGHGVGNQLLAAVAERIRACVRPADTVARLGGDEFTVMLEDVGDGRAPVRVATRILEALAVPFDLEGYEVFSNASIGIVLSGPGRDRAEHLLRDADVAMYQAKRRGGSRFEMFDAEMGALALQRLELEGRLRRAIEDDEFRLEFQPEVSIGSGRIVGMEALVRWVEPGGGTVPLTDFIPLAEETGLIVALGEWVLPRAFRQAREWGANPGVPADTVTAVNISARQLQHPGLVASVEQALHEAALEPRHVRIEITESAVMNDVERAIAVVEACKRLGLVIAIDDFGTGHSSLSYLSQFPADVLKLDRSFVGRLGSADDIVAIVEAVITMAHRLGMATIAEGVETVAQLNRLRDLGCETCQGYLFSAPVSAEEAGALLQAGPFPIDDLTSLRA